MFYLFFQPKKVLPRNSKNNNKLYPHKCFLLYLILSFIIYQQLNIIFYKRNKKYI